MICTHPSCTGVHDKNRPYRTWCPRTRSLPSRLAEKRRYGRTVKGILTAVRSNAKRRGNR